MSLLSPPLIAFLAIAEQHTVHGAAAAIHLTQTAVTQRIRSLERALNTTLFIRTRKGMKLTEEGEALLRYCQASKALEGEALAKIRGGGVETEIELKISAPTSMMHSRIIPNCLPVMKRFPHLLLHFEVEDGTSLSHKLRAGQIDLAVMTEEQLMPEMQHKALQPEQYVLVGRYDWKKRPLKTIIQNERIIDFDEHDQVTFNYLKQFNLFQLAKHSRYFVNRTDDMALLVSQGMGYTTLAKEFAQPYVERKMLTILNRSQTYNVSPVLAWYERPTAPRYFTEIIEAIK